MTVVSSNSLVQALIKQAHVEPRPTEVTIPDGEVVPLAEYLISVRRHPLEGPSPTELAATIRAGDMLWMGLPLRVIGTSCALDVPDTSAQIGAWNAHSKSKS